MTYTDFLSSFIRNSSSTPYLSFSDKYYFTPNICLSLYQDQIAFLLSWPNPDNNSKNYSHSQTGLSPVGLHPFHVTIQISSVVYTSSASISFYQLLVAIASSIPKHQPKREETASGLVLCQSDERFGAT